MSIEEKVKKNLLCFLHRFDTRWSMNKFDPESIRQNPFDTIQDEYSHRWTVEVWPDDDWRRCSTVFSSKQRRRMFWCIGAKRGKETLFWLISKLVTEIWSDDWSALSGAWNDESESKWFSFGRGNVKSYEQRRKCCECIEEKTSHYSIKNHPCCWIVRWRWKICIFFQ